MFCFYSSNSLNGRQIKEDFLIYAKYRSVNFLKTNKPLFYLRYFERYEVLLTVFVIFSSFYPFSCKNDWFYFLMAFVTQNELSRVTFNGVRILNVWASKLGFGLFVMAESKI